ncbi:MAG: hypothetical protein NWR72_17860, partial [Bacteroidia bacterium]|nr:hypothetical protein [Bacteroidia bacterium]
PQNLGQLLAHTGVKEVHGSASVRSSDPLTAQLLPGSALEREFPFYLTREALVREMKENAAAR